MDSSKKLVLNSMDKNNQGNQILGAKQFVANSKLNDGSGILCNIEPASEYLEEMKEGYLAMKEINVELSEYGFESCMKELLEYEASL